MKFIGKLHDGTIFTKKGHDEEPFEFKIDEGKWFYLMLSHVIGWDFLFEFKCG